MTDLLLYSSVSIIIHELIEKLHLKELFLLVEYEHSKHNKNKSCLQNKKYVPPLSVSAPKEFNNKFQSEYRLIDHKLKKFLKSLGNIKIFNDFEEEVNLLKNELANLKNQVIEKVWANSIQPNNELDKNVIIQHLEAILIDINKNADLLFCNITDELILENLTVPYIDSWYENQIIQKEYYYKKIEDEFEDRANYYKRLMIAESKFVDQIAIVEIEIDNYIYLIEEQSRLYDIKMDEMVLKTTESYDVLEQTKQEFIDLENVYEERANWIKEARKSDAAIIIQNWWRKIYEKKRRLKTAESKKGKGKKKGGKGKKGKK